MTADPLGRAEVTFDQSSARRRVEAVPLAQLSVELGHLYRADYREGPDRFRELFESVAPYARAAIEAESARTGRPARVSTCYLVDDYFSEPESPREVLPPLLAAAERAGVAIDYLARESACAQADRLSLAEIVHEALVAEPVPGFDGARPPFSVTGWLANGRRSGAPSAAQAMNPAQPAWRPPRQNVFERHSVFVDVELWDEVDGRRTWSCAFLAAVWQALRLGLLRDEGRAVLMPRFWTGPFPGTWGELPAIVQLTPRPAPFAAYRTVSVLPNRFLPIEMAVRTILEQFAVDPVVVEQAHARAGRENVEVPAYTVDKLRYIFL